MKIFAFFFVLPVLCFFIILSEVNAQVPVGRWRAHLSYDSIHAVTGSDNRIFAAAETGILVYNKQYNSTETLDKVSDLSDVGISTIAFSTRHHKLFIGYRNGNLDIMQNGHVFNHPDIKRDALYPDKSIANICFTEQHALLACSFGIAVFDVGKEEFLQSYRPGGTPIQRVHDVACDGTYLYAATDRGLFYAEAGATDLYNPDAWDQVVSFPGYNRKIGEIEIFNGFPVFSVNGQIKDQLYYLDNLHNASLLLEEDVEDLRAFNTNFFVGLRNRLLIFDLHFNHIRSIAHYPFHKPFSPRIFQAQGTLWIGDGRSGLIKYREDGVEKIVPDGPFSVYAFDMVSLGDDVFAVPGGYDRNFNKLGRPAGISKFFNQQWKNDLYSGMTDFVDIMIHPEAPGNLLIGTWGNGLIEIMPDKKTYFTAQNSTLESYNDQGVRVHHMNFDPQGNLWILNYGARHPVKFRDREGNWKSFEYEPLQDKILMGLTATNYGFKWGFVHDTPNLFVIDDNRTPADSRDDRVVLVEPKTINGSSFMSKIYAIAEDQQGDLWIATDEGICVDYSPTSVFDEELYRLNRLRYTENGYTQYLLRDNYITEMAVDPGNQIWFATKASGIYVYNAEGQNMAHHFTADNSPLLTDSIQSLTINESGEVFIGTTRGLVSYRGESAEGKETFKDAYAFPNPVPPDYRGPITITNLVDDVNIKITDINGNLVYEDMAKGGQAVWDGKNLSGQRLASGVYLIFMTNQDGSQTHIEKLLLIK